MPVATSAEQARSHKRSIGLATILEAADYLSVHRRTVERMMARGELQWRYLGRRRRIFWQSLRSFGEL